MSDTEPSQARRIPVSKSASGLRPGTTLDEPSVCFPGSVLQEPAAKRLGGNAGLRYRLAVTRSRLLTFFRLGRESLLAVLGSGLFATALVLIRPSLLDSIDYVLFYQPNFHFLLDALHDGRCPLWNPYIGLGRPYLADLQNAVFYPPLYLVCLGPKTGVWLLLWLHSLIALTGMKRFGTVLGAGPPQAWFMAFTFLACGALTGRWMAGQLLYCCAVCYVPVLFHSALRAASWNRRSIAVYALLLGLQFLCGHPQVFWFSAVGQVAFILGRSLRQPWRDAWGEAGRALFCFGVALIWCAGLVAVVLGPFWELVEHGNRTGASPTFANYGRMEWRQFATLFAFPSPPGWVDWEKNVFVGVPAMVTGLAGLLCVRDRNVRGLLAVLLAGLLIAVGDGTPLFGLFHEYLPAFALFRLHARAALLVVFALICAAGVWLSRPRPGLRTLRPGRFSVSSMKLFLVVALLQAIHSLLANWTMKRAYLSEAIIAQTAPDHPYEATLATALRRAGLLQADLPPPRVCVPPPRLPPNAGMIHGFASFDAYTSLFLQRPWEYLHAALGLTPGAFKNTSVSPQVYERGPFPYPDLDVVAGWADSDGTLRLSTNVAPRAYLAFGVRVAESSKAVLAEVVTNQGLRRPVWVERSSSLLPSDDPSASVPVSILHYDPNTIQVDLNASRDGLLVLAEAWYPGWHARIDGRVLDAIPVNFWMRGFPVPAGKHRVEVFFRQRHLGGGAVISMISLGFALAMCRPKNLTLVRAQKRGRADTATHEAGGRTDSEALTRGE